MKFSQLTGRSPPAEERGHQSDRVIKNLDLFHLCSAWTLDFAWPLALQYYVDAIDHSDRQTSFVASFTVVFESFFGSKQASQLMSENTLNFKCSVISYFCEDQFWLTFTTMLQILQQIKGIVDDDDDDAEPDYDVLSDVTQKQQQQQLRDDICAAITSNPDVISCGGGGGGGESQRSRPYNCSNKTLRSAFVKRYNALSKRSAKNKSQRRPGLQQVFDNAAFHRDHV